MFDATLHEFNMRFIHESLYYELDKSYENEI